MRTHTGPSSSQSHVITPLDFVWITYSMVLLTSSDLWSATLERMARYASKKSSSNKKKETNKIKNFEE